MDEEVARRAMRLATRLYTQRLATQPPQLQGAIIADLMAMFLARFPAQLRADLLEGHVATVIKMIPIRDQQPQRAQEGEQPDGEDKLH